MKKLIVNGEGFQAEKIIKTNTDIFGYDINGNVMFSFKGISNFLGYELQDENGNLIDYELPQPTIESRVVTVEKTLDVLLGGVI